MSTRSSVIGEDKSIDDVVELVIYLDKLKKRIPSITNSIEESLNRFIKGGFSYYYLLDELYILLGEKHGATLLWLLTSSPTTISKVVDKCINKDIEVASETCSWFIELCKKYRTHLNIRVLKYFFPNSLIVDEILGIETRSNYVRINFLLIDGKTLSIVLTRDLLYNMLKSISEDVEEESGEGKKRNTYKKELGLTSIEDMLSRLKESMNI